MIFKNRQHFKNSFTLIELLVTISIIAILAGLLQPALYQAKKRAKYTKWLVYSNNLRSDPSLVGQWLFLNNNFVKYGATENDSIVNDAHGLNEAFYNTKAYNGEIFSCTKSKTGRWNKGCVYLAGNQNSYIKINDGALYNPDKLDMTILIWFKPTTKNTRFIICKGNARGKDPGWCFYSNKKLYMRARADNKYWFRNRQKVQLELDKWHLAALVFDQGEKLVKWYIDGEQVYTQRIRERKIKGKPTPTTFNSSEAFTLIGRRSRKGGYFRGYIDELEIFKRAFTAKEIKNFYEVGSDY